MCAWHFKFLSISEGLIFIRKFESIEDIYQHFKGFNDELFVFRTLLGLQTNHILVQNFNQNSW